MSIDSIITDLLLQWEDSPSLTAEELCRQYKDRPDYMALLGAVKQGRCDVQQEKGTAYFFPHDDE